MIKNLAPIIGIDEEKCVNCHACITACPVKYCNDGSDDHVTIDSNMCIGCGSCLNACTHDARYYIDDFDLCMNNIGSGEKMVAIVAPSIAANFPDKYLNLNGWLHSLGIEAIFDVSFGAELTIKSYIEYIMTTEPELIIAQPCPVIVSFIELYYPELRKYLAPVDSPMLHTMKMIRKYYSQYDGCKIVAISPCLAKKREFIATGYGDYNVGYQSLANYFTENNIDLDEFEKRDYDNPPAERAVLFSSPGGLLRTAERWMPGIREKTRKIEGIHTIYEYLKTLPEMLEKKMSPLLIDCLNCEMGCNAGPLTIAKDLPPDEIEYWVEKRNTEMKNVYLEKCSGNQEITKEKVEATIEAYWKEKIYARKYHDLSENTKIDIPTSEELNVIFKQMRKNTEEDIYNCTACGYFSCEGMATAIFNGKNRPENCHFYLAKETEVSHLEIKDREHYFRNILETSMEGFFRVDNDFIIKEANNALCEIWGKENHEIVGKSLYDFTDNQGRDILNEQQKLRLKSQRSSYEISFYKKDGTKGIYVTHACPLYDNSGEKIGSFGMLSDITALRNINENLEKRVGQRTKELKQSLNTTKAILENMPFGVMIVGIDKKVRMINDVALAIMDKKEEDVIGRICHDCVCPAEKGECPVLDLGQKVENSEKMVLRTDGKKIPVLKTAIPVVLEGEDVLLEAFIDITDQKNAEDYLRVAKEEAEVASRTKSQFLANMSHELRTPINAVMGFSDLMKKTKLDNIQNDYAETIISSGEVLLALINDILDISKIEAGEVEFELTEFDLELISESVIKIGRTKLANSDVELLFSIEEDMPKFFIGDPMRIRQIMLNLFGNAMKFTDSGEIILSVSEDKEMTTSLGSDLCGVVISIKDTGIGISSDKIESIFGAFTQADSSTTRKYGGTGLGLSIVKSLVESMGGHVKVATEVEKGSEFILTLPLKRSLGSSADERASVSYDNLKGLHVLIVDDNQHAQAILRGHCEQAGMEVVNVCSTADEALRWLQDGNHLHDIILSDIGMPEMDGYEFAKQVRQLCTDDNIKLVAVTSDVSHSSLEKLNDAGFDVFSPKPVIKRDLYKILQSIIDDDKKEKGIIERIENENSLKGVRVLIVEDNPINLKLVRALLKKFECVVDVATDGQQAVDKVKQREFDLVLMDLQMPVMSGFEATEIIRKEVSKTLPIVALTAAAMIGDEEKALKGGMNDYLTKPIDVELLKSKIAIWKKR